MKDNWINKKILVAEDEMLNFTLIRLILQSNNFKITHASNGEKAVNFSKSEKFDLILMDIKMPIMDGFEATKEIRKFDSEIIIIAQTAYAFKREECLENGFTDYLSKPFNEEQLLKILEQYLD